MIQKAIYLPEPTLAFGHGQCLEAPKDGLFLFGPFEDAGGRHEVRLGFIGTQAGAGLLRAWLGKLRGWIGPSLNRHGAETTWAPPWPGFQAVFGLALPDRPMTEVTLDGVEIDSAIKRSNRSDAVRTTVKLYADAIRRHRTTEERQPDVWVAVIPDVVFRYGRPAVAAPPRAERTASTIISSRAAKAFYERGDLFPETMADAEVYLFANNFHHQLKAELLGDKVALQLILERTLQDRALASRPASRGLQDEATVAWNFATTLYFKMDAKPWALADVRPGVCYVGLVFKNDETPAAKGEACCAAQMFLSSGDGLVFRGALGPWYSEENREYHLSSKAAGELMASVIDGYKDKHGRAPSQLFIHGRHRFSRQEWEGFKSAVAPETSLVGVRIRPGDEMRLFRPAASTPVLRGAAVALDDRQALLWTRGYIPRLATYPGFETPKPLSVEVTHGDADLEQVLGDVLALTKVNYNACDFASGIPVTLRFADRVGEILMASPRTAEAPPLPFRYYI
ncbi:MAG: hypothetical protein JNL41_05485 [Phenylobacterium sp.]|uniref:argonaute/piwi family protein n=1 Tax=Phenylobacterium sp. TaxID=1871053 RepID=UPI001A47D444|nr:hypothetical protein [Phenylobacterium sp.]MBL8553709.1 hypothetical protein [Phenylobacterium sp.]